jgi:Holliday junction resolvase RusA-like endonuclease
MMPAPLFSRDACNTNTSREMNIACNLQSHDGMQNAKNAAFMWMCRRRAPGNQNQYYRHDDHSGLISSTKFLGKKRINRTSNGMVLGASSSSSRLDASTTTSTSSSTPTSKVKVKRKTKKRVAKNSASAKNNASLDTNTRATTATISPRKVKRKTAKPKAATKRKTTTPTPTASTEANVKTRKTKSKKKKKARAKRKKADPKDEPVHFYRNHTDTITIRNSHESESDSAETTITTRTSTVTKAEATIVKFKVRGNPAPLARHRTYRGFIFNPSAKKQKQFCDVVLDMLPLSYFHPPNANSDSNAVNTITKGTENVIPIFQEQVISVQIISRMKRPQKHFLANRPGPGRLRQPPSDPDQDIEGVGDKPAHVASHLQVTRTDVDNLAKFVLDSLNGVIYTDDKQVASLTVTKVYDDEEPWTGSTDVIIKSMTMEDLNGFLEVDL